ncbi:TetR/AcrR family transcriptional regulator [Oceanobacillus sojae]|uniref:TetR/AcrR family transcriptional regulator n=1 Tax=Oceanobacillus sojae TaxID=582851 RepID=UPI00158A5639|nr:TetR/AcrR family transcriptional regulator [Oceanobacillus sojae]
MTKEKILKAAINQYSLHNYHGATMKKIADEVNIKPASIYFFYKNKEELFLAAFKWILESHLTYIQNIMGEVIEQPILNIYQTIIRKTVAYHRERQNETNAYISLVNSPPAGIKPFLHEHMQQFDIWMEQTLTEKMQKEYPDISKEKAIMLTKQFLIIMDGIFWEINIYEKEELEKQMEYAINIIECLLREEVK